MNHTFNISGKFSQPLPIEKQGVKDFSDSGQYYD